MKIDWTFPKYIALVLVGLCILGAYPLSRFGSPEMYSAVIAGIVLSTVNVLLGYAAIEYSFGKSMTTFLKYVLGGMGIRILVLALALLVLLKVYQFHAGALVASMGICYAIFLTLEIFFIQKKIGINQQR